MNTWKQPPITYLNDDSAWEKLVQRYADGRKICNCKDSWCAEGGTYLKSGKEHHDGYYCYGGCSTSCIIARNEIAVRVLKELTELQEEAISADAAFWMVEQEIMKLGDVILPRFGVPRENETTCEMAIRIIAKLEQQIAGLDIKVYGLQTQLVAEQEAFARCQEESRAGDLLMQMQKDRK